MDVHSSPWRMNEKNNRGSDKWPLIVHVKSSLARKKKKRGEGEGCARAEPMTLPFSVMVMVKPVRMQVISANIKKYFTSIRGHTGNIDSPFSNEIPSLPPPLYTHCLPRPICIQTEIPRTAFVSHRIALVSTPWDGLINQTPHSRARVFEKLSDTHDRHWWTIANDRENNPLPPAFRIRLKTREKKIKETIIPSTIVPYRQRQNSTR